jgi:hypothetical protein
MRQWNDFSGQELYEVPSWPPDHTGECDICHANGVAVWTEPDDPGDWDWCQGCIEALAEMRCVYSTTS